MNKKYFPRQKFFFQQTSQSPIGNLKKRVVISLFHSGYLEYKLFVLRKHVVRILLVHKQKLISLLATRGLIRLGINRQKSNTFLNFVNLFTGRVYSHYSCGQYFQGSLRKSKFAFEALLDKSKSNLSKTAFLGPISVYLTVRGSYVGKGFRKNLKAFVLKPHSFKLKKFINIQFRAHNGVRKRHKRRK